MILKIFDERNNNYTFIDKVDSVEVNESDWCFHCSEDTYLHLVMSGYSLIDENDTKSQRFISDESIRRDNIEVDLEKYQYGKNINVVRHVDRYFLNPDKRYKTTQVYSAKVLTVFLGSDTPETYAVRCGNDYVYLLNDQGKTIDRL
jgi:hypothetical protein